MKKTVASSLTLLLSVSVFAGCSSSKPAEPTNSKPAKSDTAAPAAAKPEGKPDANVLKVGYLNAADSPVDMGAKKFAELVDKGTNGKVKVEIYNNGVLGGEKKMLDTMKFGALDMVITGDAAFAMYTPKYAGLSTPYLFRDQEHLTKVLAGDIGKEIAEEFHKGLNSTVLDYWDRSPRNLTANKEIKEPKDLKGLKLRVPEIPNIVDSWSALGANPTPMAFSELFTALDQKVVDGQENPVDLIYTSKFYEVQKYMMQTEHLIAPFIFLVNDKKLTSFPQDVQKVIKDAAVEAGKYEKDITKKSELDYIEKCKQAGMKVVQVDKTLFAKKLEEANVEAKYADQWAPNLLKRIRDVK
jgi:TRAP-type transport system periplasmic protein